MMQPIEFFVPGVPKPAGSKRGFVIKRKGAAGNSFKDFRAIVTDACKKSGDWKLNVKNEAVNHFTVPLAGPLRMDLTFFMPRPKSHFRTGKHANEMRDDAPDYHTSKPDRTKLTRGTEDAMTGIAWVDDAQVVDGRTVKRYADGRGPGVLITIREA